jgi:L-ascorbate metabolism protein UlaG (beta-lactamase superfamily)
MAILTWYGHSCFKLDMGEGGSLIFDPYAKGTVPGVELPEKLTADMVLCSHDHHDHNASDRVTLSGRTPLFEIERIDTYHDEDKGSKRGNNIIHIVKYKNLKAAHFGDLGCPLTEEQAERLGGLDLALIPVGGFFTIDRAEAKRIIDSIKPKITVPMHYRRGDKGFNVLSTIDEFVGQFDSGLIHKCGSTLDLSALSGGIYVMEA